MIKEFPHEYCYVICEAMTTLSWEAMNLHVAVIARQYLFFLLSVLNTSAWCGLLTDP